MPIAVYTDGSQTATVTTEHTLATITDAGVYQLWVDCNAMTGGSTPDILEIRYYVKVRSTGTERLSEVHRLVGAQSAPGVSFKPIISPHYLKITLKQTHGTGRAYPWAVYNT